MNKVELLNPVKKTLRVFFTNSPLPQVLADRETGHSQHQLVSSSVFGSGGGIDENLTASEMQSGSTTVLPPSGAAPAVSYEESSPPDGSLARNLDRMFS